MRSVHFSRTRTIPSRTFPLRLPIAINASDVTTRTTPPPAHLVSLSSPLTSPLRTPSLDRVITSPDTMCTYFTLSYKCGHSQTSHRCPRSTVYVHGKNGEQVPHINGCEESYVVGANLGDICIDCKMQEGLMPGVATGVDKWSLWGPKEEALSVRVKMVEAGISETESPIDGGAVQGGRCSLSQRDWGCS